MQFHSQVPKLLARAAIFASLQTADNYPSQALLEAMGAGCAIIASDVGQTRQIVTDDIGVRVMLTVESVADAIVALVNAPGPTRQRGAAAAHRARTTYSADTYAAFLESLYDRAPSYHRRRDH